MILNDSKLNLSKSKKISAILLKGQIINEYEYCPKVHDHIESELFNEVRNNFEQYQLFCSMMNISLKDKIHYFYASDEDIDKIEKNKNKNKIYAAMIVLIRFITNEKGLLRESLENINYGIDENDLEGISNNKEYSHIINKARLDNGVGVIKTLSERNLLVRTNRNKYILTNSGKAIISEVIERFNLI